MKRSIIATALLLLLSACGEPVQGAPEAGDNIHLPPIEWRVRDRAGIVAAYVASGQPYNEGDRLDGFAGHEGGRAVVYTLPPRTVDDRVACTLGHEVMHVALGGYHR